ncbi:TetR/AcrR family transcriptional regulator [Rhodococcus sp. 05-340-1]|uniref:TetR/AcrR family transcriptional regulator n=1 Tax=Nocardiaceae TaxID=85025 RepID=UPI00050D0029|nr:MULTISPECIES: TetR/AcrR family transcriptional regulator [Rhodococcus]OZC87785.1 TetR/AcrR family transcriptional regulator [Rhodococcus sp. 06-412-2C]OZC96436.1 TetR/AcrR family transcriptional regulator [Rhodococcus sp. 06-412-2B]OZD65419.1 TetR/AcrR family transcriptional regulator [Rhodococcus sp. 05-340-2]OZD74534.1 TetR/AcrR family transcriptional regulator [Rhodococcus sp. 05-340-1]OZD86693.1 TetR/AcrR family transcriptional regulator [Rhodococcus sp. 05-339-2]
MTSTRSPSARTRILSAAAELFYADGIAATGIDTITAAAGVAKMSLYNNFESKNDLVEVYLGERHEEWLRLHARRRAEATTSDDRVLAVFDAYLDHARMAYPHGFRGCGLLNAAAELPADAPGRVAVRTHKEQVESIIIEELSCAHPVSTARTVGEQLSFILEGAMSRAGLEGKPDRVLAARAIAENILATL